MTNGDGSETSAVQISAPGIMPIMGQPIHYAHWAKSAVVKGKLYLFGGWIDNKKVSLRRWYSVFGGFCNFPRSPAT